jgi:hypothetical protein
VQRAQQRQPRQRGVVELLQPVVARVPVALHAVVRLLRQRPWRSATRLRCLSLVRQGGRVCHRRASELLYRFTNGARPGEVVA